MGDAGVQMRKIGSTLPGQRLGEDSSITTWPDSAERRHLGKRG